MCVRGDEASFGRVTGVRPDGVRVSAGGRCRFSFWAGGFDGFISIHAGAPSYLPPTDEGRTPLQVVQRTDSSAIIEKTGATARACRVMVV